MSEYKIVKTMGICGGDARIDGTRIPIWLIIKAGQEGMTDKQVLEAYPTLVYHDLEIAGKYYATHQEEIDVHIDENDQD